MPQTADFLYAQTAALVGQYVSLVSNKDGVTKYSAATPSSAAGQWTINPKPPAGTYALWTGNAVGVLTTLVDPDYVVDPYDDLQNAYFPGYVIAGSAVGGQPFTPTPGDLLVNRGGASPGSGAVYFGSSAAGAHSLIYDGTKFAFTDPVWGVNASLAAITGLLSGSLQVRASDSTVNNFTALDFSNTGQAGVVAVARIAMKYTGGGSELHFAVSNNFANGVTTDAMVINAQGGVVINAPTAGAGLTVAGGGITVTAGGLTVTTGGLAVNAGGANISGTVTVVGAGVAVPAGFGLDTSAAGQLAVGPTNATSIAMRAPQKSLIVGKALTALGAGAQTLTAAQLLGGSIEHTVTAAVADTFDTAANIDAAIPNVATGDTFECYITILGAFTVTLTAAAGITIKGTAAIVGVAAGKVAHLIFRRTGAAAWTVYVVDSA